eukprot:278703-Ditylum_brightwellii.AAC.1
MMWYKDQVTISDELRKYMHWHQCLQYPSHVTMVRPSERKAILSAITYIQNVSPCAAYIFAKT